MVQVPESFCGCGWNVHIITTQTINGHIMWGIDSFDVDSFAGRGEVEAALSVARGAKLRVFYFVGELSFRLPEVNGLELVCLYGLHDCSVQCSENLLDRMQHGVITG
jgi:hypothetical protein